jgi:hypothetical protein
MIAMKSQGIPEVYRRATGAATVRGRQFGGQPLFSSVTT